MGVLHKNKDRLPMAAPASASTKSKTKSGPDNTPVDDQLPCSNGMSCRRKRKRKWPYYFKANSICIECEQPYRKDVPDLRTRVLPDLEEERRYLKGGNCICCGKDHSICQNIFFCYSASSSHLSSRCFLASYGADSATSARRASA